MALMASLRYVKDTIPGITRKQGKNGFLYYQTNGKRITDEKSLKRIRILAIPPAYHEVWICPYANGHIQATGRDNRNRKQYRYHPLWQEVRQEQKFSTLIHFGRALPLIRQHIDEELRKPVSLTKTQIICTIISLLEKSCIRIGNAIYAKENKSYGLTTLRKKHLSLEGNKATLHFSGKSAKPWHVQLNDKKIIRILKKCEAIPGYELFKYHDEDNKLNVITSQDINAYLHSLTNYSFTAKDFRTWIACRETLCRLVKPTPENESVSPQNLKNVVTEVAALLGHTVSICQKNYIHPEIISDWQTEALAQWFKQGKARLDRLSEDELLLFWLEKISEQEKQ